MAKPRGKPFQKGNNANPIGALAHDPVIRKIRKMTHADIEEIGQVILEGNLEKLNAIKNDPNTSVLKLWICTIAIIAIKKGDVNALNSILDRIVGKVKEKVEHTGNIAVEHFTPEQVKRMALEVINKPSDDEIEFMKIVGKSE